LVCDIATISDKAFALLVLENIWEGWKDMNVIEFFQDERAWKREPREGKLGEDTGQVMQRDLESIVDGVLMESNDSISYVS